MWKHSQTADWICSMVIDRAAPCGNRSRSTSWATSVEIGRPVSDA